MTSASGIPPTAAVAAAYLRRLCHAFGLGDRHLTAGLAGAPAVAFYLNTMFHAPANIELPPATAHDSRKYDGGCLAGRSAARRFYPAWTVH